MRKNTDSTPLSKRFRNWVEGEDEERQELPPIVSMDELEPAARPREHHSHLAGCGTEAGSRRSTG